MAGEIILIIIAFALVASGFIGVLFPLIPGVPIAWLGLFVFGYATHFAIVTGKALAVFFLLMLITFLIDFFAPMIGAKKYYASSYGLYGAMVGFIFGTIVLGPVGVLAGPILGSVLGELIWGKSGEEALYASKGVLLGFLASSAVKFSVILMMLGYLIFSFF